MHSIIKEAFLQDCRKESLETIKEFVAEHEENNHSLYLDEVLSAAAVNKDHGLEIVAFFIDKYKANPNALDDLDKKPLYHAIKASNAPVIKLLIKENADISSVDKYDTPAISIACSDSNLGITKLLIEKNANVNITTDLGTTLHYACLNLRHGLEISKFLIEEKELNPTELNINGYRPIYSACRNIDLYNYLKRFYESEQLIEALQKALSPEVLIYALQQAQESPIEPENESREDRIFTPPSSSDEENDDGQNSLLAKEMNSDDTGYTILF